MGLKREPNIAACERTGKMILTKSQAKSTAKRMQKRGRGNHTAYRCRYGSHWHVGELRRGR